MDAALSFSWYYHIAMVRKNGTIGAMDLDPSERCKLEGLARKRSEPPRVRRRARMILACAEGLSDVKVATEMGVHSGTVANQRRRFLAEGGGRTTRPGSARADLDPALPIR